LPEEEFPSLARFEEAKIFTVAQKDLKDGFEEDFPMQISVDENAICTKRYSVFHLRIIS